jgi:hypothetical protein
MVSGCGSTASKEPSSSAVAPTNVPSDDNAGTSLVQPSQSAGAPATAPHPKPVPQTDAPVGAAWGVATDPNTFSLWVHDTGGMKQVTTVHAPEGIYNSYVEAELSPDGQLVAFLPDFTGTFGTQLVIARTDGKTLFSVTGYFTGFTWLPESDGLAVTSLDEVNAPAEPKRNVSILHLDGSVRNVASGKHYDQVLGVAADGATLYVTYTIRRGYQAPPQSFGWLDTATGRLSPIIESDAERSYADFALVEMPGSESKVVFLGDPRGSSGRHFIARLDGTAQHTIQLPPGYGAFDFSPGADHIAYIRDDGIWIADGEGNGSERIVADGWRSDWHLDSVTADRQVWVSHPQAGFVRLAPGAPNVLPRLPWGSP